MENLYEYGRHQVRSVFAQESYPGRILVEAATSIDVVGVCHSIPLVFSNNWKTVPRGSSLRYLQPPTIFTPSKNDWIKLRRRGYNKDIGLVMSVNGQSIDVLVVPRVSYQRTGKRKRGEIERGRLNVERARSCQQLELRNGRYMFKGKSFTKCGYQILQLEASSDYYHERIVPTIAQIDEFRACELLSNALIEQYIVTANSVLLNAGDRVRIIDGNLKDFVAEVVAASDAGIDVFIKSHNISATVSNNSVRKYFRIGDHVVVKSGTHKSTVGWVVELDMDLLTISEHADHTVGLSQILMQDYFSNIYPQRQLTLSYVDLDHYTPDFALGRSDSDAPVKEIDAQMSLDPLKHLKGLRVKVTGRSCWKSYLGIIKEVQNNATAIVEIQARLMSTKRTETIRLDHLVTER